MAELRGAADEDLAVVRLLLEQAGLPTSLILLTQTAAEFLAHHGYRVIERIDVPPEVQESTEFRSLCPASATCMMKVLSNSSLLWHPVVHTSRLPPSP